MNSKKINQLLEKFVKDKKVMNMLIALLVVILIYMAASYFTSLNKNSKTSKAVFNEQKDNLKREPEDKNILTTKEYEEQQKNELKSFLSKIDGVGNVDVMIYFESGEIKVPALDTTVTKSTTEETDKEGGKRINNQNSDGSKVVTTTNGNGNEPLILKTYKPKMTGVVIVAEGAGNAKIKYEISKAVSMVYGLAADKVNVLSMKK